LPRRPGALGATEVTAPQAGIEDATKGSEDGTKGSEDATKGSAAVAGAHEAGKVNSEGVNEAGKVNAEG